MSNISKLFDNDNKAILLINVGKSHRGKSYFVKFFLMDGFARNKFSFGLVFSGTAFNKDYNFLPSKSIFGEYDQDILEQYVENLKKIKEDKGTVPGNFVLFEDCQGLLDNQTKFFVNWISMYRHLSTSIIFNQQYLLGKNAISPIIRNQTTHCLAFNSKTKRTIENLYQNFGQMFETEKEFKEYFLNITKEQHVGMLYIEKEDDINKNYLPIIAPGEYPTYKISY